LEERERKRGGSVLEKWKKGRGLWAKPPSSSSLPHDTERRRQGGQAVEGEGAPTSRFVWLTSHQPAVLFSKNKPAISNQPAVLFSQNKSALTISHQPNEHVEDREKVADLYSRTKKGKTDAKELVVET
jgi:hypothetical protein